MSDGRDACSVARMSITEVGVWLLQEGVSVSVAETFEDHEIDGEAFLELTEEDVKEIVWPLGQVKRIMRLQSALKSKSKEHDQESKMANSPLPNSTTPCSSAAATPVSSKQIEIPQLWQPNIMSAIQNKQLNLDIRNEISRVLITLLYTCETNPGATHCKRVATQLVAKYPFMADTGPNKSGSWERKLVDRLHNIGKKGKRKREDESDDVPVRKRGRPKKNANSLASRYPAISLDESLDAVTLQANSDALARELQKEQPREDVILPLITSLFPSMRDYILNHATSVMTTIERYPALKLPVVIEQKMDIILKRCNGYQAFETEWKGKWAPAIVQYSRQLKRKDIKAALTSSPPEDGDESEQLYALKCLSLLLCKKLRDVEPLSLIYQEYEKTKSPEAAALGHPGNSPHIGKFREKLQQYFIFVEKTPLCYYHQQLREFALFFQESVFGIPMRCKKTTMYLATATDIQKFTLQ